MVEMGQATTEVTLILGACSGFFFTVVSFEDTEKQMQIASPEFFSLRGAEKIVAELLHNDYIDNETATQMIRDIISSGRLPQAADDESDDIGIGQYALTFLYIRGWTHAQLFEYMNQASIPHETQIQMMTRVEADVKARGLGQHIVHPVIGRVSGLIMVKYIDENGDTQTYITHEFRSRLGMQRLIAGLMQQKKISARNAIFLEQAFIDQMPELPESWPGSQLSISSLSILALMSEGWSNADIQDYLEKRGCRPGDIEQLLQQIADATRRQQAEEKAQAAALLSGKQVMGAPNLGSIEDGGTNPWNLALATQRALTEEDNN